MRDRCILTSAEMVRKLVSRTLLTAAALALAATAWGQTTEAFFAREVYPLLHRSQCNLCHNDNGVAGRTAFQFPEEDATAEQVAAFGLQMMDLIDRDSQGVVAPAASVVDSQTDTQPIQQYAARLVGRSDSPGGRLPERRFRAWVQERRRGSRGSAAVGGGL